MKSPPTRTQRGTFRGGPHRHIPAPMGSISCIPAPGCGARGPVPCSGLVHLPYKAVGLGSTERGCRGYWKAGGVPEQQCWHSLHFLQGKEGDRAGPQSWGRMDRRTDRRAVLPDPAQQIWGMWTPEKPISSAPGATNGSILAYYTACMCWRNDENKHLSALKSFVPPLILSISSENR